MCDLASDRRGTKSLEIHFLHTHLIISLAGFSGGRSPAVTVGGSGWLEWGLAAGFLVCVCVSVCTCAWELLERFPCNSDAPCASRDLDSVMMGAAERMGFGVRN